MEFLGCKNDVGKFPEEGKYYLNYRINMHLSCLYSVVIYLALLQALIRIGVRIIQVKY